MHLFLTILLVYITISGLTTALIIFGGYRNPGPTTMSDTEANAQALAIHNYYQKHPNKQKPK